ncbi:uncharacterized protein TNCV_4189401 [Trichonephila clavipes]|nr:uncharacterized protein TNCV_4189401 [Trichonephila clavipes]
MKAKRLNWAKQWRDKDVDFWRSVCFSDESTFEILQNKAQFVRRRRGDKFHSDCVVQTVKHPTKIMICSVICGKVKSLKRAHLNSVEEVQAKTGNLLRDLSKPSFQNGYQQRQH